MNASIWDVKNGIVIAVKINDNKIFLLKKIISVADIEPLLNALDFVEEYIGKPLIHATPAPQQFNNAIKRNDTLPPKPLLLTQPNKKVNESTRQTMSPEGLFLMIKNKYNNIPFSIDDLRKEPNIKLSYGSIYSRLRVLMQKGMISATPSTTKRVRSNGVPMIEYSIITSPKAKLVEDLKYREGLK